MKPGACRALFLRCEVYNSAHGPRKINDLKLRITRLYLTLLLVLWAIALISLFAGWPVGRGPALASAGLLLATSAPLVFFIGLHWFKQKRTVHHPVWVSVLSGFGAVMIMVAIYRYGDQHPFWMLSALATLAGWMLYLKVVKAQPEEGVPTQPPETD